MAQADAGIESAGDDIAQIVVERDIERDLRVALAERYEARLNQSSVRDISSVQQAVWALGLHRFNVYSWRKKAKKPEEEVVQIAVPLIIEAEEFEAVQQIMRARSPQLKAPRFVSRATLLGGICFCADCGGAMTLRTSGKGEQYRYYTCCTTARQGKTGCKGRTVPMDMLDALIGSYLEHRLRAPDRLKELLAGLLKRREEHVERQKGRIADLKKQAAEAEAKLTRLYEAIENGLAALDDANLKGRVAELRRIRDAARVIPRGRRQAAGPPWRSRPTYCRDSPKRHVDGSRQTTAASGDITSRRWCSVWRSEWTKFGLRDRKFSSYGSSRHPMESAE